MVLTLTSSPDILSKVVNYLSPTFPVSFSAWFFCPCPSFPASLGSATNLCSLSLPSSLFLTSLCPLTASTSAPQHLSLSKYQQCSLKVAGQPRDWYITSLPQSSWLRSKLPGWTPCTLRFWTPGACPLNPHMTCTQSRGLTSRLVVGPWADRTALLWGRLPKPAPSRSSPSLN